MTQWQDCTFGEAVATGVAKCRARVQRGDQYWDWDVFKSWTFLVLFNAEWRRPVPSSAPDPGEGYRLLDPNVDRIEVGDDCCNPKSKNQRLREWGHSQLKPGDELNPDFFYRRRVEAQKEDAIGNRIFEHEPPVSPELTRLLNEAKSADESWRELDGCNVAEDGSVWCHGTMTAQASTGWLHNLFCIFDSRICNATRELIRRWQCHQKPKLPTVEAPNDWFWTYYEEGIGLRGELTGENESTYFRLPDSKERRDIYAALVAAYDELNGGHNA